MQLSPFAKALIGVAVGLTSYFPLRIAIAQFQAPQPEGILTLGGARYREYATARLSRSHPELDIWISSGSLPQESELIFAQMQATTDRVNLDYSATDTLSNFTTILPQLQAANVQHIYLVTSDYHMPRAQAIATVVLGSRGIIVSPVAISSARPKESLGHVMRDVLRSVFWLATGKTGSHLKQANCYGVNELEAVVDLFKPLESQCHQITRQP